MACRKEDLQTLVRRRRSRARTFFIPLSSGLPETSSPATGVQTVSNNTSPWSQSHARSSQSQDGLKYGSPVSPSLDHSSPDDVTVMRVTGNGQIYEEQPREATPHEMIALAERLRDLMVGVNGLSYLGDMVNCFKK